MTDYICVGCDRRCFLFQPTEELLLRSEGFCPCAQCETEWKEGQIYAAPKQSNGSSRPERLLSADSAYSNILNAVNAFIIRRRAERYAFEIEKGLRDDAVFALLVNGWPCIRIAELFDEDVTGYLLAAVQDADTAGLYNGFEPQKKNYMDNVMKMKDPYSYFQAGVILFNLAEFRKSYTVDEMFEYATSYEWELLDQDVLNHFAEGRVKYLDMRWNVIMDWHDIRINQIIGRAPRPLYLKYMASRKDPYVIHYAGPDKPWDNFESDYADFFWTYASHTPFMPLILERSFARKQREEGDTLAHRVEGALRPAYVKLFPDHSMRREKAGYILRKLTGRW